VTTQLWSAGLIVGSTLISSVAAFFFKQASSTISLSFSTLKNKKLIGGIFLYAVSAIIAVIAYRGGELTVLVPLASLNYVWAALLAQHYLKEDVNKWKWLGIFIIVAGLVLIGLGDTL
jgi:drug/metabolite transporter (DMT)-like permease